MEGKAEKTMRDLGKKLDQMIADLEKFKSNINEKYGDRWEEINRNKSKLEEEVKQFKEKHKERFEEAEINIERAAREIKKAFETMFSKKKNTNDGSSPTSKESSEH